MIGRRFRRLARRAATAAAILISRCALAFIKGDRSASWLEVADHDNAISSISTPNVGDNRGIRSATPRSVRGSCA
ncbi:MAG: hypothetical protein FJ333_08485 [Sphingomonadales bacterium]|nr:hypothetical protein [Sphingomonadales bacterium]